MAVPGKNVKIVYEGCFPDGRVFDKNQNRRRPLQFRVGEQIPRRGYLNTGDVLCKRAGRCSS